ncbi:hypothetical protein EalM132_00076 [Exiguobacterium phage vB_EalM-132]|nr:hypothetical protein EalM132_00076 [Exiguobacterium phage vB_EalM-132]
MSEQNPKLVTLRKEALNNIIQGKTRTHEFTVDFTEVDENFKGTFVVHQPSQMELLEIGVLKSKLLSGAVNPDVKVENLAIIMSTLEHVCDTVPSWFNIGDPDISYEILETVYMEYLNWVNTFRKKLNRG